MRHLAALLTAAALAGAIAVSGASGCTSSAVAVESCRQIEEARCRRAPGCNIPLSPPLHDEGGGRDVAACIRFYHDACLHGFEANADRGTIEVRACVAAISTGDCSVVKRPQIHPDCAFLTPPPPPAPAVDAAADAAADADAGPALDAAVDG
jgi:hypothetical protein